ncbi:hypothetical protein ACFLWU_04525 [Chloroflexota bacterium]
MSLIDFKPHFMSYSLCTAPFRDIEKGCQIIADNFPEAVPIPRFAKGLRHLLGGMPCLVIDSERRRLYFDISSEREGELVNFYDRYLAEDLDYWAISPQEARGMFEMLDMLKARQSKQIKMVSCAVPGPLNLGYTITDKEGKPCLFDDTLRDIMIKHLAMKAAWMERRIRQELPGVETAVEMGEPALSIFTSAVGTGTREDLQKWLNETLERVEGIRGFHCCANADWPIILDTDIDYLHFDAYQFGDKLALYSGGISSFLERGGMIMWGIIPNTDEGLAAENLDSLEEKLENMLDGMVKAGVDNQLLSERSFVSTCCDTSNMSAEMAEKAFQMTKQLTERMRQNHPL